MKKYIITGATGHLGLNLVNLLVKNGEKIKAFVMQGDKNVKYLPEDIEICYGNIVNLNETEQMFLSNGQDDIIVIHCAGYVTIASKYNQAVYDVNVTGTKNVADLCLKYNVKRLVYVSSVHAIKELPNNEKITETSFFNKDDVVGLYSKTKAEATRYVLEKVKDGLNAVVVHPSGIIGPYDYGRGHTTQLIIDFYRGRLTAGVKGGYDFVDARDVAEGIISAAQNGRSGECYILSNRYYSVKEILGKLSEISGKRKIRTFLPIWFIKMTAYLAELYYKILRQPPLYTKYSLYTLQSNSNFSNRKAVEELNYKTRDLEDTLKDTIAFLKESGRI